MGLRSLLASFRASAPATAAERLAATDARLRSLSEEEAESEVRDRVMMTDPFRAIGSAPNTAEAALLAGAPPSIRSLFATYAEIEAGGARLARADVAPFPRDMRLLRVGTDVGHADVVVRLADGRTYVVEDDGAAAPDLGDEYASIWHYLVGVAEATRPRS